MMVPADHKRLIDAWKQRYDHYKKFFDIIDTIGAHLSQLPLPSRVGVGHLEWDDSSFGMISTRYFREWFAEISFDGPSPQIGATPSVRFVVRGMDSHRSYSVQCSDPEDMIGTIAQFEKEAMVEARKRGLVP